MSVTQHHPKPSSMQDRAIPTGLRVELVDGASATRVRVHGELDAASAPELGDRLDELSGAGRALLFNLLALPVALVLFVTGVGAPLVFLLVNAVLLGRELQDMVWPRHRPSKDAPAPLRGIERLMLGGVTAFLLTVPVVNFIAPFLGAACAVHLIHRKGLVTSR